jgi:hypothetical protein
MIRFLRAGESSIRLSHLTFLDGWTHLPDPKGRSGIRSRLNTCMGCHRHFPPSTSQHRCISLPLLLLASLKTTDVLYPAAVCTTWAALLWGSPFAPGSHQVAAYRIPRSGSRRHSSSVRPAQCAHRLAGNSKTLDNT